MARDYLKKATLTAQSGASDVHDLVQGILSDIEEGGDDNKAGKVRTCRPASALRARGNPLPRA